LSTKAVGVHEFVDKPVDMPGEPDGRSGSASTRIDDGDRCPRGVQGKPGHESLRQRETVDALSAVRFEQRPGAGAVAAGPERVQLEGPEAARSRAAPG
jgi:hypothetical protein